MEKQKFEDSLKDAFQEARLSPSENVWTNIELDLERLESGKMRRRLLFFKLLAAASVAFAMAAVGAGYYINQTYFNNTQTISSQTQSSDDVTASENNTVSNSVAESKDQSLSAANLSVEKQTAGNGAKPTKSETLAGTHQSKNDALETNDNGTALQQEKSVLKNNVPSNSNAVANSVNETDGVSSRSHDPSLDGSNTIDSPRKQNSQSITSVAAVDKTSKSTLNVETQNIQRGGQETVLLKGHHQLPLLVAEERIKPGIPKTGPDELELLLATLAGDKQLEEESRKEKSSSKEKMWTSVGFSAGAFNNASAGNAVVNQSVSAFNFSSASNTINNEKNASGYAYSVGVSLGGRISERWVIQGGLSYMTQMSDYTSNAIVTSDYQNFSVATSYDINKLSTDARAGESLLNTASYSVSNSLQFISVPVQAGFIVLDKSFGIQINGGVSTDLFIQSTITPEGNLGKVTNGRESDSPYKPLNFSALFGTELSYRFADHYRLALVPGIRYPFSSIYKSELKLEATPVTFDVGLRFRYIFN